MGKIVYKSCNMQMSWQDQADGKPEVFRCERCVVQLF